MLCPRCLGKGFELNSQHPCSYQGCHAGHIHCCDGVAAQLEENSDRPDALTAEFVSTEGLGKHWKTKEGENDESVSN
jgi:hypothetical protein